MKTDFVTGGFGGGFTDGGTVRSGCRATAVLPRDYRHRCRVDAKKDARPVLQHRTGASNGDHQLTDDSIARLPRWKRWGLYAVASLTMSGIIPAIACNALLLLCETVGWWLLVPLYVVVGRALWRVMWS